MTTLIKHHYREQHLIRINSLLTSMLTASKLHMIGSLLEHSINASLYLASNV